MAERIRRMFGPALVLWLLLIALLGALLAIHYYHKGLPEIGVFGVERSAPVGQ